MQIRYILISLIPLSIPLPVLDICDRYIYIYYQLFIEVCIRGRAGFRGGVNRAIARGPTFSGSHELFEKIFFYYLYKKNVLNCIFLIYY